MLIVNDEPHARALARGYDGAVEYGLDARNRWHAANIAYGLPTTFDLMHRGNKVAALSTKLLGAHNIENIVGISALLLTKQLLSAEELAAGVATFEGVKRRMELLSPASTHTGPRRFWLEPREGKERHRRHAPAFPVPPTRRGV